MSGGLLIKGVELHVMRRTVFCRTHLTFLTRALSQLAQFSRLSLIGIVSGIYLLKKIFIALYVKCIDIFFNIC